jgi:hypothetical protein
LHALSSALQGSCGLDVNLKLFDVLGRIALDGLWAYWGAVAAADDPIAKEAQFTETAARASSIKAMISSNPALFLPAKDSQSTDIAIAALLLALNKDDHPSIHTWLGEMMDRASFSFTVNGHYPSIIESYPDLLVHPKKSEPGYRNDVTSASVLYPLIALFAAITDDQATYSKVTHIKRDQLAHCDFQLWYPDVHSEEHLYTNDEVHGLTLSDIRVDVSMKDFLAQVFAECARNPFERLSASRLGYWPLIVVASRHYRLPLPPHFVRNIADPDLPADPSELGDARTG